MPGPQHSVTVIGDLLLELSTRIEGATFAALQRDALCYAPIRTSVGGTGANFALAAVDHFAAVNILGRVGEDAFGGVILKALVSSNVHTFVESCKGVSTGTTLYLRDSSSEVQHGVRLLVIDRGANRCIDQAYIENHVAIITQSDIFFLDGYSFMEEPRRSASEHAMKIAKAAGVTVALDLVPHNAHQFFRANDVASWFRCADLVIAEVRTIRRALGYPSDEEVHDAQATYDTCDLLRQSFPGTSFHLRFGVGNIERSLLCEVGQTPMLRANGYVETTEPKGFGDRLSAADLADYLSRTRSTRR